MDVELLYFEGCPNWQETEERLHVALRAVGDDGPVVRRRVETAEEAERLGFHGSPTVLVDGRDPFADPSTPVGLTCRLFRTPAGLAGAPAVEQLVQVLRRDDGGTS